MQEVSAMTVSHGKPYAGNLHVRFDEGYPPKNGEARFEGSRRPSGRSPRGAPLYSTSSESLCVNFCLCLDSAIKC